MLTLKGFGAGDLIYGANADGLQFVVENDGSLRLGNQGDPSDTPILRLDAVAGTVANASGSGLPVAFGILGVDCSISLASSTSNFSSTRVVAGNPSPRCNIVIEGAGAPTDIVFDVTHRSSAFVIPVVGVDGNAVSVSFQDGGGSYSLQPFSFVAYVAN